MWLEGVAEGVVQGVAGGASSQMSWRVSLIGVSPVSPIGL